MKRFAHSIVAGLAVATLVPALFASHAVARPGASPAPAGPATSAPSSTKAAEPDGAHDFDFNLGTWHTHIRRLVHPLTGSTTWAELEGTVTVRPIWDGRAQLEEVNAAGADGHFQDLGLFLYNPVGRQWSFIPGNSEEGQLSVPMVGRFSGGRGEFYDQEPINGRVVLVRGVFFDITPQSHRFEQAFSTDGGKTWEINFVALLTRT